MKNRLFYIIITAVSIFAASCSTKSGVTPVSASQFKINGNTYIEANSADSSSTAIIAGKSFNVLAASGYSADKTAQGVIELIFMGSAKPKAGSYTTHGDLATLAAGQVSILVIDKVSVSKQGIYGSAGTDGSLVVIAVSSSGKLTATLPNIEIKGSNFDNTDPKNTKATDVTGSISGTITE
jgi:hypothetical protein